MYSVLKKWNLQQIYEKHMWAQQSVSYNLSYPYSMYLTTNFWNWNQNYARLFTLDPTKIYIKIYLQKKITYCCCCLLHMKPRYLASSHSNQVYNFSFSSNFYA